LASRLGKLGEGAIVQIGVTLRNMGEESTAATMRECAAAAETLGFESLWITDHVAIPPDDAEGSGGRYVDPLITLAWMSGFTKSIRLGVGVIVLPYRTALPFAKQVAALQELSEGRLLLGVGVGWMAAEFKALGVDRSERGRRSDEMLEFLRACFAADVMHANGQAFLFKPRPSPPPILVGGAAPHALMRAARFGDAWLPMAGKPDDIRAAVHDYHALTESLGRPRGSVTVMSRVDLGDASRGRDQVEAWRALGIDRLVCGLRYRDAAEYRQRLEALARSAR
jgi:probable F420-dependent oxidoreductase